MWFVQLTSLFIKYYVICDDVLIYEYSIQNKHDQIIRLMYWEHSFVLGRLCSFFQKHPIWLFQWTGMYRVRLQNQYKSVSFRKNQQIILQSRCLSPLLFSLSPCSCLSVSVLLAFYVCVYLSVSVCFSLFLSVFVCLCLFLCFYICIGLTACVRWSVIVCSSLFLRLYLSVCQCLFLSLLSLSVCLSVHVFHSQTNCTHID